MTAMQLNNANALFQEIARIPEEKQEGYITAMRTLLLGARLAEQPPQTVSSQAANRPSA